LSPRGIPKRRRFKVSEDFEDSDGSQLDEEEDGDSVAMETDESPSQNNSGKYITHFTFKNNGGLNEYFRGQVGQYCELSPWRTDRASNSL
jgi:hypothetical protein